MQDEAQSFDQRRLFVGRRLLLCAALIAVIMVMIRHHFHFGRDTFEGLVLIAPAAAAAVLAAYLPSKITLSLASFVWLFYALHLTSAFSNLNVTDVSPESLSYFRKWHWTANAAQILATGLGAAGLWFMWAGNRLRRTTTH